MDVVSVQQLVRMWEEGRKVRQSSGTPRLTQQNEEGRQLLLWSEDQVFGTETSCLSAGSHGGGEGGLREQQRGTDGAKCWVMET